MNKKKIIIAIASSIAGIAAVAGITIGALTIANKNTSTQSDVVTEVVANTESNETTITTTTNDIVETTTIDNSTEIVDVNEVVDETTTSNLTDEYLVDYPLVDSIYIKNVPNYTFNADFIATANNRTSLDMYTSTNTIYLNNGNEFYFIDSSGYDYKNMLIGFGYTVANEENINGFTITTMNFNGPIDLDSNGNTTYGTYNIYLMLHDDTKMLIQLDDRYCSTDVIDFYKTTENPIIVQ